MALGKGSIKRMIGSGESFREILKYWFPELISQTVIFSLPPIIDSYLIASLHSTALYGTIGATNNFLHLLLKFAEALPVAVTAIIARHNGAKEYEKCGKDLGDAFWATTLIGGLIFSVFYFGATTIYQLLGVPAEIVELGVPFLELRSFSIPLIFISFSFIGFMKGVKNTTAPMIISAIGSATFIFFDYVLVLGKFGFPQLRLNGSSIATIIQYSIIIILAAWYILTNKEYKKYFSDLFLSYFSKARILGLLNFSWPLIIDKSTIAISYVWLFKMIAPMGIYAIASFDAIKNLERGAFLPAIAFAQITVFLVSNRLGAKDPEGARSNIKKVLILTSLTVCACLLAICVKANYFISFFDPDNKFTHIAAPALILISALVVFDFIQLILAGALRGAGDVKTVMWVRVIACLFFFAPLSYVFSHLTIASPAIKFALIYSSFYLNTAVIGFVFMKRIIGNKWQNISL